MWWCCCYTTYLILLRPQYWYKRFNNTWSVSYSNIKLIKLTFVHNPDAYNEIYNGQMFGRFHNVLKEVSYAHQGSNYLEIILCKYSNSNNVKYYFDLNEMFYVLIYFKMYFIPVVAKLNYADMLMQIWRSLIIIISAQLLLSVLNRASAA